MNRIEEFQKKREILNKRVMAIENLGIKRFFNLDTSAYQDSTLEASTKELLGLVAFLVLRCNDFIDYRIQCVDLGWTDVELYEAFNVNLVVGGSIVIPHLRHAVESLFLYRETKKT